MSLFTFNFKIKAFRKALASSLFWLIIVSLLFDTCFFRSNYFYALIPNSSVGQIEVVSKRLENIDTSEIKVVILGDSHTRNAFRAEIFSQNMGVNPDKVYNLSLSSGNPIDAYNLYMRHRSELNNVKYMIIGVSEGQFNKHPGINPDQKFRRYATITDRFQDFEPRYDMVLGYFCASYDHREIWKNAIDLMKSNKWPPPQQGEYRWGLKTPTKDLPMDKRYTLGKERLLDWYAEDKYEISDNSANYFVKLIKVLKEDNKTIIIINTPKSDLYYNLKNELNLNDNFNVYKNYIYDVCAENKLDLIFYDNPWENKYFDDINHLNEKGADRITKEVSDYLR